MNEIFKIKNMKKFYQVIKIVNKICDGFGDLDDVKIFPTIEKARDFMASDFREQKENMMQELEIDSEHADDFFMADEICNNNATLITDVYCGVKWFICELAVS